MAVQQRQLFRGGQAGVGLPDGHAGELPGRNGGHEHPQHPQHPGKSRAGHGDKIKVKIRADQHVAAVDAVSKVGKKKKARPKHARHSNGNSAQQVHMAKAAKTLRHAKNEMPRHHRKHQRGPDRLAAGHAHKHKKKKRSRAPPGGIRNHGHPQENDAETAQEQEQGQEQEEQNQDQQDQQEQDQQDQQEQNQQLQLRFQEYLNDDAVGGVVGQDERESSRANADACGVWPAVDRCSVGPEQHVHHLRVDDQTSFKHWCGKACDATVKAALGMLRSVVFQAGDANMACKSPGRGDVTEAKVVAIAEVVIQVPEGAPASRVLTDCNQEAYLLTINPGAAGGTEGTGQVQVTIIASTAVGVVHALQTLGSLLVDHTAGAYITS